MALLFALYIALAAFLASVQSVAIEYNVTCRTSPNNCGLGGFYTLTQTKPTVGSPLLDPTVTCAAGDVITFLFPTALGSHPFNIIDKDGNPYPGISPSFPINTAGSVSFTCPANLDTVPAYYTCTIHGGSPGDSMTAPIQFASTSICDKYSKALNITNLQLVTTVVQGTEAGLLANATTLPFFNGKRPLGSTNFSAGGAPLAALTDGLVKFFGAALGCTDGTITAYTGQTLDKVHANMGVDNFTFDVFNQILLGVTAGAGVTAADNLAISGVLNSTRPLIVLPPSICDKYSRALNITNLALVTTVVQGTETGLLANATTLPFFNGQVPAGSTDFTQGGAPLAALTDGLVKFFGAALTCRDGTIGAYTGKALDVIHKPMGINDTVFDTFNQILLGVTAGAGVTAADNQAILGVLNSTRPQIVFQQSICDKYSKALNITNLQLVTTVVQGTEAGLLANATTLPFFNGKRPLGSTNFSAGGAPLAALTDGLVKFFGAALGCTDGTITAYTGQTLDKVHANMGVDNFTFDVFNQILLGVTAGAGVTAADNLAISGVLNSTRPLIVLPPSICDKYSRALNITNLALVTTVVQGTETGLLANATTLPFFNGQVPAGSTDFTQGGAPLAALTDGLVKFFGAALTCRDGTIGAYTGKALDVIHQPMGINDTVFDTFNQILLGVTAGAGVTAADNQAILGVLETTRTAVVKFVSICDKYSKALNITNLQLVTAVVQGTEAKLLANATTLPYFNGQLPAGSTDFTNAGNAAQLAALTDGLVKFFGGALGCTDGTITAYTGKALDVIHQPMMLDNNVFDTFNQLLLSVTGGAGVSAADNAKILTVLESTRTAIVFVGNQPSGAPQTPTAGGNIIINVTCGSGPLACGTGGVYAMQQIAPTVGTISGDPDIQCSGNDIITFRFPGALATHPFQIIGADNNPYPGISAAYPFSSAGDITFQCGSFLTSAPAYYTCLRHGGTVGSPMSGNIVYLGGGTPTAPTDAPPTFPPTEPPPTAPPPPSSIVYDVTCGGAGPCGDPGSYTLTMTSPQRTSPAADPTVTCGDGDTVIFNFPVALGRAHPFQIIDQNGNAYPGLGAGYPITTQGQVQFTCNAAQLSATPAYYTCLVHGGLPGASMTGRIQIGALPPAVPTTPTMPNMPVANVPTVPTAGTSICDKYSNILRVTNLQLVTNVVTATIAALLKDPLELPFFNGKQPPGSTDFTTNTRAAARLSSQLINFFGGALGCSDGSVPAYVEGAKRGLNGLTEVQSLATIHQPMNISQAVFDRFNQILIGVLASAGVASADQTAVLGVLNSLNTAIVRQVAVPSQAGPTDPNFYAPNSSPTGVIVGVIIVAVLCALVLGALIAGIAFYISGGSEGVKRHDDYDLL